MLQWELLLESCFFGKVGLRVYPSCDLDWAALYFEALGARRLDLPKIPWAGSWIITGCEVRQICSLSDFFFFKLVWFSVRFPGSIFSLKLTMQSMWRMLISSVLVDS